MWAGECKSNLTTQVLVAPALYLLDLCTRNKSATFLKCPRINQRLYTCTPLSLIPRHKIFCARPAAFFDKAAGRAQKNLVSGDETRSGDETEVGQRARGVWSASRLCKLPY